MLHWSNAEGRKEVLSCCFRSHFDWPKWERQKCWRKFSKPTFTSNALNCTDTVCLQLFWNFVTATLVHMFICLAHTSSKHTEVLNASTAIWQANCNMYLQNISVCCKGANDSLSARADWKRAVPPTWAVWFCNLYWDFTCLKRFTNVYLNEKKYCCFGLVGSLYSKGLACTVINKHTQHW